MNARAVATEKQTEAEALAELRASRSHRLADIHAINFHRARGMSRRALIRHFGADLVNDVFAGLTS